MDVSQLDLVESFLDHLRLERRLSPHTVKSYRRDLDCLAEFCMQQSIPAWGELRVHHLRHFAATSHASGLSPRSIQRRLSGARSFLRYLIREGCLQHNPAADVSAPRTPKRLPATLDAEQMARLLDINIDISHCVDNSHRFVHQPARISIGNQLVARCEDLANGANASVVAAPRINAMKRLSLGLSAGSRSTGWASFLI